MVDYLEFILILNHMVDYKDVNLDLVFAALGDPNRRAILARLKEGEAKISDLPISNTMSLTGVTKHIRVLEKAGLVSHEKRGRERYCKLEADVLREAGTWIESYREFWGDQLDQLDLYLKSTQEKKDE
ncbi:MAG: metalloregulator ArsR/SmtB family transcription factor [Sneathiellales bacterium]|nr:metalloregulator ArsR/SmtB family transcription factor [Sneathiellales bacterium]